MDKDNITPMYAPPSVSEITPEEAEVIRQRIAGLKAGYAMSAPIVYDTPPEPFTVDTVRQFLSEMFARVVGDE